MVYKAWRKKSINALCYSIEHWKRIKALVPGESTNGAECACCVTFLEYAPFSCDTCPIAIRAAIGYCRNTPYTQASHALYVVRDILPSDANQKPWLVRIQTEIDYLEETLSMVMGGDLRPPS